MPSPEHLQLAREAIRLIRDRGHESTSSAQLSRLLGVSEAHLRRVFVQMTGRRLVEHRASLRLVRAAFALRLTHRPIIQIAMDAGYANPESFSRAFRAHFNTSPRVYRHTHSESSPMTTPSHGFSLQFVKVPVTDFAAARVFYRDVLGLPEAFAVEAYGWAQYDLGPIPLCLYVAGMGGGEGTPGGEAGFHLQHPDLNAVVKAVTEAGHPPASDIDEGDDGCRGVTLRDPDGNTFKVLQNV